MPLSTPSLFFTPEERNQLAHLLRRQRDAAVGMAAVCDVAAQLYGLVQEAMKIPGVAELITSAGHAPSLIGTMTLLGDRLTALEPGYIERTPDPEEVRQREERIRRVGSKLGQKYDVAIPTKEP